MRNFVINCELNFEETYLVKGKKYPRVRLGKSDFTMLVPSFENDELPIAFVVKKKYGDKPKKFYFWNDNFYTIVKRNSKISGGKGKYTIKEFIRDVKDKAIGKYKWMWGDTYYTIDTFVKNEDEINGIDKRVDEINNYFDNYIIIGNSVYQKTGEPRYLINTFGLGHNHGGTGMFIDNSYNSNISKNRYFNALQRDECVRYGILTAERRGDTESLKDFGKSCRIEVLMPEVVKCNPQVEHGEGCEFINRCESVISNSSSVGESGIMVMALGLLGS